MLQMRVFMLFTLQPAGLVSMADDMPSTALIVSIPAPGKQSHSVKDVHLRGMHLQPAVSHQSVTPGRPCPNAAL